MPCVTCIEMTNKLIVSILNNNLHRFNKFKHEIKFPVSQQHLGGPVKLEAFQEFFLR